MKYEAQPLNPEIQITEAKIADALSLIPYAKQLAIRPLLMGDELTLILPYGPHIIGNPMLKALHGGAVGAFMETAAIVQLWLMPNSKSPNPKSMPKPLPKPIGINIDYLRRGKPQDTFARAKIAKQGARVANVRVRAWQNNYQEPISILHGHFLIAKPDNVKAGDKKPDKKSDKK